MKNKLKILAFCAACVLALASCSEGPPLDIEASEYDLGGFGIIPIAFSVNDTYANLGGFGTSKAGPPKGSAQSILSFFNSADIDWGKGFIIPNSEGDLLDLELSLASFGLIPTPDFGDEESDEDSEI